MPAIAQEILDEKHQPDVHDEYRIFKGTRELKKFPRDRVISLCIAAVALVLITLMINFFLLTLYGAEQRGRDFKELGDKPIYWERR